MVDDIDAAEYRLPPSARLYLLRGDLNAGIDALDSPIAAYRLPATTDPEALRRVALTRDKEWGSLRVEDFGHCSLFLSWAAIATAFNQILVAEVDALEETTGSVSLRSAGRRSNFNEDGCAGPNDERGFGLCHLGPTTCGPDQADKIELCTRVLAEPCSCMIFDPPAPSAEEPYGYLVPLEGCRRYSERFPGQVRCGP